jgi:GrpB-like predicted nucleotidyltransferase (UPF0157 family)
MNLVFIEDYDPRWPQTFELLRSRLSAALPGMAAAIEHIGSTAVPGLAAKPIIDIDLLMNSEGDLPRVIVALTSLGYDHRGDLGIAGREAFQSPSNDLRHHLYVCPPSSREYPRHIAFRDYLRAHPESAAAYGQLKRDLAQTLGHDREAYTQGKSDFVREILCRVGMCK